MVVVVVVPIVIVGVLVADQCRGNTNTSSCAETHSGTALTETERETELMKPRPPLQYYRNLVICTAVVLSLLLTFALILAFSNTFEHLKLKEEKTKGIE